MRQVGEGLSPALDAEIVPNIEPSDCQIESSTLKRQRTSFLEIL
jgi:hypothetical protein